MDSPDEASERRYRELISLAPIGVYRTSRDGRFVSVNAAFARLLGYETTEEVLRLDVATEVYFDPSERERIIAENERLGDQSSFDLRFKRRDGHPSWVRVYARAVRGESGAVEHFDGFVYDIDERRLTEEALQKSEQRFSLAFQASPIPTSISEIATGRILDVNEQFLRTFGYAKGEVVGKTSIELGLWANRADRDRVAERILRDGAARDLELQARTRSGEIRDVMGSAVPIDLGGLPCVLSTFLDVTDRKRAEKEMHRSEERFRRLFESNTIGIAVADLSGVIVEANDGYLRMLGYTRDELLAGKFRWDTLTPPEYRARDQAAVEQLQRTGVAQTWEKEFLRRDGTRVPVFIGVAMLGKSEGLCLAYIVDLTGLRRAEEAMRVSEERYRLLFESNPEPMWVFDRETLAFLAVNEAACRHYGYSREEFLGMTIEGIRPAEEVPALRQLLDTASPEYQRSGAWRHRKKDGSVIEVEISSNPLILTDVTERRSLEQQLRQAQKMEAIGQLAGGIAHDFNNLLTVILGFTELAASEIEKGSGLSEPLGEIRKAGERAAALTRQLLAFSRRQVLEPKILDLNALITDLEKMLRRLIGEDVQLATVLDPGVGRIRADAGQIEQVILNLAVNSRDAMPRGGKLTIETRNIDLDETYAREHIAVRPGAYAMLAISDTGTGMSAETKSHMFEPFFTTKGTGKGTGLGLATVYGIVKQSGGNIWVYSEPHRGTAFKVYLPLVEGASGDTEPRLPDERPTRASETVLLVEDENAVRMLTRKILERYGYSVLEAGDGEAALEMARNHSKTIHLLLTDVVMPDVSGPDLAVRVRQIRPDVKVLFMSGYTDDAVVRHGILADGVHFLQKPFTPEALGRKVRGALDAPSAS
jgi:two-component system cell cycle sensor histidine kinase/response regulator CckA